MLEDSDDQKTLVSQFMTSRVRTARPDQGLEEIRQMLLEERCHHIPIVDEGRPVGMISARDLVRVSRRLATDKIPGGLDDRLTAREIMSTELETIRTDESIEVAIDRIGRGDNHALIGLDQDRRLAGIVTDRDLFHFLMG